MYVVVKATVKIESFKIFLFFFIFSLILKAFKGKSILRFNLNRCFYYNIYTVILITTYKLDLLENCKTKRICVIILLTLT
jgi:hypothetical protein